MIGFTEGDMPQEEGKYVCWVNPDMDIPYAKQVFLMWMDGYWWHPGSDARYREIVYGYAGPVPSLRLNKEANHD